MNKSLEAILMNWVPNESKIIDFGCGDGTLLKALAKRKATIGYGVENDPKKINACINNGVSVL